MAEDIDTTGFVNEEEELYEEQPDMEEEVMTATPKKKVVRKKVPTTAMYKVVQIPTQVGEAIQTPKGEQINATQLLVDLANRIKRIEEAVA